LPSGVNYQRRISGGIGPDQDMSHNVTITLTRRQAEELRDMLIYGLDAFEAHYLDDDYSQCLALHLRQYRLAMRALSTLNAVLNRP